MNLISQRRFLQFVVTFAAFVPVLGGAWGALDGVRGANAWSSDHYRYLSGLLLGIGLCFWSTVPHIERHTGRFRILTVIVFIGGLCRLMGVAMGDPLSSSILTALGMELLVTPLLCLWQTMCSEHRGPVSTKMILPQGR
jgi:hypothetical protein